MLDQELVSPDRNAHPHRRGGHSIRQTTRTDDFQAVCVDADLDRAGDAVVPVRDRICNQFTKALARGARKLLADKPRHNRWIAEVPLNERNRLADLLVDSPNNFGLVKQFAFGDHPEWYGGLPRAPRVPMAVTFWKKWLRPIGFLAIFGAIVGAFGHHLYHGNKGHIDPGPVDPGETKG